MAGFFEKRSRSLQEGVNYATVSELVHKRYPTIATLLEGTYNSEGQEQTPPFSLTLFAGEGETRFVFSSKETGEAWFGTAGGTEDVLAAIEKCLVEGKVSAKQEKRGKGHKPF